MATLDLLALILIPAALSAGIALIWQRLFADARYALAVGAAVGFAAGCWLFPDRLPLMPERHWHWLPYVGLIAAVVGGVAAFAPLPWGDRALLYLLLGGMLAMFLLPTWSDLQPTRPILSLLLAVYFLFITLGLVLLPERLRGRGFLFLLMLAAAGTAVLVSSEVSLRLGSVSLRVATSLGGCWAASWLCRREETATPSSWPVLLAALVPLYVALTGGSMFVAAIEVPPANYLLLLAPAAPLTLWLFAGGPLAKLQGLGALGGQSVAVLVIPGALLAASLF